MSIEKPDNLNNAEPVKPTAETEGGTADTEAMLRRVQERVNTESGELTEEEAKELAEVLQRLDLIAQKNVVSTPEDASPEAERGELEQTNVQPKNRDLDDNLHPTVPDHVLAANQKQAGTNGNNLGGKYD